MSEQSKQKKRSATSTNKKRDESTALLPEGKFRPERLVIQRFHAAKDVD